MIQSFEDKVGAAQQTSDAPMHFAQAMMSGFEGREAELGLAISAVFKTLQNVTPYPHQINDAVIKAWLTSIQFAKDQGALAELVAHDIKTMEPINIRLKNVINKLGNNEIALIGIFDHTACHYQLVLDTQIEPGKRTWTSPYKTVLEACVRIGQFDLTEQEIHEQWTMPRLQGYAEAIGVALKVSPWRDDGVLSCELME
jgi:hypothetical protein